MRRPALAPTFRAFAPAAIVVCLTLFGPHAAWAQRAAPLEPTGPLSLQQAVALALSANPDLPAAAREIEAMQAAVQQSEARPNPELYVELEDTRSATRSTTVQINQPIELGGKRAARIDAAQRDVDIAQVDLRVRRAELRARVTAAFHALLAAQDRALLATDSAGLARRASDAAAKRVLAGKVSPVEETKARVAEAGARVEAAQAAADLRAARQSLAVTWGSSSPRFERAEAVADSDLPTLPSNASLLERVTTSPALERARIEVQRRKAMSEVQRSRQVPDVTLSLGMKRNNELNLNQAIFAVTVPLPVFDSNRGNLLDAMRREDKSRDELAAIQLRLDSEVLLARERLGAALGEARLMREDVLPGAQSAYDAVSKGFELGKFDFLEVLDAQRTLFQARSQYLRSLADAQRAAADIELLIGDDGDSRSLAPTKP